MHSLKALLEPSGIVVVGASVSPGKLGAAMAESLASFPSSVALVNSRSTDGSMFPSVAAAAASSPVPPDLAVLCVPAAATAQALRDCAASGVKAALACAGGFSEAGEAGAAFETELLEAVADTGIRLLGPNTSGFFVPHRSLRASFVPGVSGLNEGSVAVVAASGGVNHVLAFQLQKAGVAVSLGIGIGAGLDIAAPEVLDYLVAHEETKVVALHIENVTDGPALLSAVRRLTAHKPMVALVVGRSDVSEFARSHTGALATSWRTTRSALKQAGAVVVDDEMQLVEAAAALSGQRLAPSANPGVGLITGQAGPGLIIADALHNAGVSVPRLSEQSQAAIGALLPPLTFQANPVDTGRPGEGYDEIVAAVASDPSVDLLAVYGLTEPIADLPASIASSGVSGTLPILVGVDGPDNDVERTRKSAQDLGLPILSGPTSLARGLVALVDDARVQFQRGHDIAAPGNFPDVREPLAIKGRWDNIKGPWDEIRSKELLEALGISTPPRRRCADRAAAHHALTELGVPVAVKLVDAGILHKTEIGGVHLGVDSPGALDEALDALQAVGAREFLVEAMAPGGVDLVVGARRDPVFGPIVVLGLGGTAAEVLADVAIRTVPLSERLAAGMADELHGRALLDGFRNGPVLDPSELSRIVVSLGNALLANEGIAEIEINPLRLTKAGLVALDAVVINA
ncbi:acetate--CoA ligase family protein [Arthrobacter sp. ISL-30]|uniref:acetate--CoA ligase family protein n=1 Tax=Arthrobacter sp. ISL-30 TaxID=2819109 RepID=UPI001BEC9636|nr:acetate--CoA ligase family protein [Arthrobacter sp. ISL-30]MBT2515418.1 acetate--CoA ligase family protein [Arthrobacter sp. ISL-30]